MKFRIKIFEETKRWKRFRWVIEREIITTHDYETKEKLPEPRVWWSTGFPGYFSEYGAVGRAHSKRAAKRAAARALGTYFSEKAIRALDTEQDNTVTRAEIAI